MRNCGTAALQFIAMSFVTNTVASNTSSRVLANSFGGHEKLDTVSKSYLAKDATASVYSSNRAFRPATSRARISTFSP